MLQCVIAVIHSVLYYSCLVVFCTLLGSTDTDTAQWLSHSVKCLWHY